MRPWPRLPLLLALVLPAAVWADEAPVSARVDRVFSRFATPDSPGCAVAVGRDGQTLLARAYGQANLEHGIPNTPDTVFEAGSVSKQFTVAAVVLLAQEGKLSLDDSVRRHVPELPDYGVPITLRHLIHHTSGLRDWGVVLEAAGWPRGTRIHTHAHVLDVVSRQKALNFPPGSEYSYSNTGYNLLAIIVERVSGQSFADFTKQRLFLPLGMTRTQWRDDFTRVVKGRATAYTSEEEGGGFHSEMPFENVHGNGGLLTTVGDLLRWNEALAKTKPGLLRELERQGRLTTGRQLEYAGGLVMRTYRGVPEVNHAGATAGYRAFLSRYPRQKLSVALLCNLAQVDPGKLAHEVADIFLEGQLAPLPEVKKVTLAAEVLAARAGLYRYTRTGESLALTLKDGQLVLRDGTPLVPVSATRFQVGDGPRQLSFDKGVRMLMDDGDILPLEPVAQVQPDAARLAEYGGTYVSDEAEVTYTLAVEKDALVLRRRPDAAFTLVPLYDDAFRAQGLGLVRFIRDASGRVGEMSLGLGRVRDLRLPRVPPAPTAADRK